MIYKKLRQIRSGGRTRTSGLRVMSPTSYQLLYPAMLDYKGRNIFLECKTYFKKYVQKKMFGSESLCRKSPSEILVTCKISEGDFLQIYVLQIYVLQISYPYIFINSFIPAMSVLAKDFCSPVVRFLSWMEPASASLPPLMERNGMDFFSA